MTLSNMKHLISSTRSQLRNPDMPSRDISREPWSRKKVLRAKRTRGPKICNTQESQKSIHHASNVGTVKYIGKTRLVLLFKLAYDLDFPRRVNVKVIFFRPFGNQIVKFMTISLYIYVSNPTSLTPMWIEHCSDLACTFYLGHRASSTLG